MEKGTSEIAKLTERISKDPKSKLFVPLAEEYKKAGDIEMAIAVLTEGLKNNPGYVTAKSFLGRLLLDKGDLKEAQNEFEEVIKAIPDNVLAQRKLADIHVLQGRPQEALIFFKAVLAVNPKDPELKALVADIEAGRDVRERIAGPKGQPEAGHAAAVVPTPVPPRPAAAPVLPVKPPETPVVPPRTQTAPVSLSPSRDAEEPEEVLVFESLDEAAAPAGAFQQPEPTQDMFAELGSEAGYEEAARMDDAVTAGEDRSLFDAELSVEQQPISGMEPVTMPSPDRPAAAATEREYGSTDTVPGTSFFDSESAPIDIPAIDSVGFDAAAAPDLPAPVTEHESGSTDNMPGASFFDSEPMPIDIPAQDSIGFDAAAAPGLSAPVTEHEFGSTNAGVSDSDFFDVEPVETEAESLTSIDGESGEEPMQVTLDVPAPGPDIAAYDETAAFGETLPEADDFTTDTLAELYIAQGFYEKAIEIYERMLADRPNSRLLKDKLDNVRAMGSASNADEQGTPIFFEAPGSPPPPSPQPMSAGRAEQRKSPVVEREAKEYSPPPADNFEPTAFDSGFAPVEYVLPEAPPSAGEESPVRDEGQHPVTPKTAASGKEQIIGKLDNWLKNIMKEK